MSTFDFIVDNIRFSYSSTSSFGTCAYGFKMTYIDGMPRENNFYAEYGLLVHDCMEKLFNRELDIYELSEYYRSRYEQVVISEPPPFPAGMYERYRDEGQEFFDNLDFDINKYTVLVVEAKLDFDIDGIPFVAKPDLVLRENETNKISLFDYKTSTPFKKVGGKLTIDKKKMEGYYTQMYLYTYALRNVGSFIPVDEISLWFPRVNHIITIPWNLKDEEAAVRKVASIAKSVLSEEEFKANPGNRYFCDNLCSVRKFCEFRN